jgi:hypothetical protein
MPSTPFRPNVERAYQQLDDLAPQAPVVRLLDFIQLLVQTAEERCRLG